MMVKSNQLDRASQLYKDFKTNYPAFLQPNIFEDLMYANVIQYEKQGHRSYFDAVLRLFVDASKLLKEPKSGKLYAITSRALLKEATTDDLLILNKIFEEPKKIHMQYLSQLLGVRVRDDQMYVGDLQKPISRSTSVLDEISHDSTIVHSPTNIRIRFFTFLAAKSWRPAEKIDKTFLTKLGITNPVKPTPCVTTTNSVGIKSLVKSFDELKSKMDAAPTFDLQKQLESISYANVLQASTETDKILNRMVNTKDAQLLKTFKMTPQLKETLYQWQMHVEDALKRYLAKREMSFKYYSISELLDNKTLLQDDFEFYPIIEAVGASELSHLAVSMAITSLQRDTSLQADELEDAVIGERVFSGAMRTCQDIGYAVMRQFNQKKRKKSKKNGKIETLQDAGPAMVTDPYAQSLDSSFKEQFLYLPMDNVLQLGGFLLNVLMDNSLIQVPGTNTTEEALGLHLDYQWKNGFKKSILTLHPHLNRLFLRSPRMRLMDSQRLPMVVPPRLWKGWNNGGYLTSQEPLLRVVLGASEQLQYVKEADKREQLTVVKDALNVLSQTSWVIHSPLLEVASKVWESDLGYGDIPPRYTGDNKKVAMENYALRCSFNYKLEIACRFKQFMLFFPHNVDFRGRAYPIPSYLNHIDGDLSRALLRFSQAKPLGQRGWDWLRIHLANLYGFDKAPFEQRIQFTMDHLEDIKDSAKDPLGGDKWWLKADSPWQCLSTCMEIANALEDDPLTYQSNMPVHQDGSCNGLQHYAAIGGDPEGAALVNLVPQKKPADVYTMIAKRTSELIGEQKDEIAQFLKGKVDRKFVKQTTMTTVYGVTFMGAKEQVLKRMKEAGHDFGTLSPNKVANYGTKYIFEAIGELFERATLIQEWLNKSAQLVARSVPIDSLVGTHVTKEQASEFKAMVASSDMDKIVYKLPSMPIKIGNTTVTWTAPNGLVCVQPYKKMSKRSVPTKVGAFNLIRLSGKSSTDQRRQAAAFPPNFIHSLDASHMMFTAIECAEQNVAFASVHDSYWTHACNVDQMNEALRNSFIRLHKESLVQNLRSEFVQRYKHHVIYDSNKKQLHNLVLEQLPKRGSFNVDQVKDSSYFFQ